MMGARKDLVCWRQVDELSAVFGDGLDRMTDGQRGIKVVCQFLA
jgi:hypothetical protein